ncbi:histone-fold-containing protein [Mycena alexandri]|uniref:Histone-fold-containing protein n=1 Tax=Mycena alexandri TaxID=1745969 RepID=A0AAD6TDE3_9AGAR|nr:histone-fold-containing protein [Mycena alexandri]
MRVVEDFTIHIRAVFKQVHTNISTKAMAMLNSFVNDIVERIAPEASKLTQHSKKSTISSRTKSALCYGALSRFSLALSY